MYYYFQVKRAIFGAFSHNKLYQFRKNQSDLPELDLIMMCHLLSIKRLDDIYHGLGEMNFLKIVLLNFLHCITSLPNAISRRLQLQIMQGQNLWKLDIQIFSETQSLKKPKLGKASCVDQLSKKDGIFGGLWSLHLFYMKNKKTI